ncbi:MAG: type IV pilus modification PilV family protein [Planctomycetota bacterium]|jgi:prepilin-type N-terminal cleavage/methylation domain-containing protein
MNDRKITKGFSLIEVLISIGILAVGILLVASVFPVALHFATEATERTISSAIAEEAFSKLKLFAMDSDNIKGVNEDNNMKLSNLDSDEHISIWAVGDDTWTGAKQLLDDIKKILPSLPEASLPEDEVKRFHAELTYPSHDLIIDETVINLDTYTDDTRVLQKQEYCWSAIMRLISSDTASSDPNDLVNRLVQVTVFVNRRGGRNIKYYRPDRNGEISGLSGNIPWTIWPAPVKIEMRDFFSGRKDELEFAYHAVGGGRDDRNLINDGYFIVDDETGQIYRVMERYSEQMDWVIRLDRDWDGASPAEVWVIPPPIDGGASPCIGVFQRVIRF